MTAQPYYADDMVSLYLADCRDETAWLAADVLVTDPPYGIGWSMPALEPASGWSHRSQPTAAHDGIEGDQDTALRDAALSMWLPRPGAVFGSWRAPFPAPTPGTVLVWKKPADSGLWSGHTGFRRDTEAIFLIGKWPRRPDRWSSVLETRGTHTAYTRGSGHPHAKPVALMCALIHRCPPGVIADPFAGSGSTLVAAKMMGRRAIGVEVEERYAERAARRLTQDPLPFHAPPDPRPGPAEPDEPMWLDAP